MRTSGQRKHEDKNWSWSKPFWGFFFFCHGNNKTENLDLVMSCYGAAVATKSEIVQQERETPNERNVYQISFNQALRVNNTDLQYNVWTFSWNPC